jgi:hypothetical protein
MIENQRFATTSGAISFKNTVAIPATLRGERGALRPLDPAAATMSREIAQE